MSSTTDRGRERGQVLVIFALTLVTLLIFAALAFDTGTMLLERRDQQNAADAAALAGARYLPDDQVAAESAARSVATANGFTHGVDTVTVDVTFPFTGRIEVDIANTKASIFGGIIGRADWAVGARAVAVNQNGVGAPFAMLSLDPNGCDALLVSGSGTVTASGNIQVNSDCTNGALKRSGGGTITVTADGASCNVVGDIKDVGSGALNCTQIEGAPSAPDPLVTLPAPPIPAFPSAPLQVGGTTMAIPAGCPGAAAPAVAATADAPATCQFQSSYAGTTWRLYPGYYPGGIKLQAGTFYLEPGIYYIGGGGVEITGSGASATSVDAGGTTLGGGVMFYNTDASNFSSECAAGTALDPGTQCIGAITLNGAQAQIDLWPLNIGSTWDGIVIYQDRNLSVDPGDDIVINGSSSDTQVRGTIYAPSGDVTVNGSGGEVTVDQVIANRFKINGGGGTIDILYDSDFIFGFTAAGLVE